MENRKFVDQKAVTVRQRVMDLIGANPGVLARQGAVVESWRVYRGHRLGPYYRLTYRIGGCQRSIYLGSSEKLADEIRKLLADLQAPRRNRRTLSRLRKLTGKSLADQKKELREELAKIGLYLKGNEVRGMRNLTCFGAHF